MLVALSGARPRWYQCVAAAALIALSACTETPTEPTLKGLVVVQAPPAKAVPGWILRDTIKVRVVNDDGSPRAGTPVTWSVTAGGGTLLPIGDVSDQHGLAMAVWTLGPLAGPNEVSVRVSDEIAVTLTTSGEAFRVDQLAGADGFACGLASGELWCWGSLAWTGTEAASVPTVIPFGWEDLPAPGRVHGAAGLTQVAVAGWTAVCALDGAGGVWCASFNAQTLVKRADVPPLRLVVGATNSADRFCGLTTADSTAWCWNLSGAAMAVPGSPAFLDLDIDGDTGWYYPLACGTLADSSAACWGTKFLGDGSSDSSATPVPVAGGHHFAKVAVGTGFACGRKADGSVWCWGRNDFGELNVPGANALSPVFAESGITHITASSYLVLALKDGGIIHWGGGDVTAGPIASLEGLSVSDLHAKTAVCLSLTDGQVYCVEEMWDRSSVPRYNDYAPVQPAMGAP
jgi:Regulator of chromosome condensation (RCC1) repeat